MTHRDADIAPKTSMKLFWAIPFLAVCGVWVLCALLWNVDFYLIWREITLGCTQSVGECFGAVQTATSLDSNTLRSLKEFLYSLIFFYLISLLAFDERKRNLYLLVVCLLGICAAATITGQIFGLLPQSSASHDLFWVSINRVAGIFTDPNAFGIAGFLFIGVFLVSAFINKGILRAALIAIAVGWGFLTLYSGSRTFFVGLAVSLIVFWGLYSRKAIIYLIAVGALALTILQFIPLDILTADGLPAGLVRLMHSLDISNIRAAIFSREVFWIVALRIWISSPLIGIGFNQFELAFPKYAHLYGYQLNGWVDNPNSFYLGVLSELGIVGFLALLYAATHFRRRSNSLSHNIALSFACGFAVQLLFGPHIDFIEVALLAPILISYGYIVLENIPFRLSRRYCVGILLFVAISAISSQIHAYRGIWGTLTAWPPIDPWISRSAYFELPCVGDTTLLKLHAPFAQFSSTPLSVHLSSSISEEHSLTIANSDKLSVKLSCVRDPSDSTRWLPLSISAKCSRYWVPARLGISRDRRPLCLQLLR